MITFKRYLTEGVILNTVRSIDDLKDPNTGKYYTDEISVMDYVDLHTLNLTKLPVQFGTVGGDFYCYGNELTTLEGVPREIGGDLYCDDNQLTSLEGIHKLIKKIGGVITLRDNPIKSGGIGLILIEGLRRILTGEYPAFTIIEKYLGQGKKGVLLCQDELIDAGYEEFAKL